MHGWSHQNALILKIQYDSALWKDPQDKGTLKEEGSGSLSTASATSDPIQKGIGLDLHVQQQWKVLLTCVFTKKSIKVSNIMHQIKILYASNQQQSFTLSHAARHMHALLELFVELTYVIY